MTVTNTQIPVVTGTPRQGQTLHTDNGQWTFDLDYLTYTYQWRRCDAVGANCVDITGATASAYTLTAADVGHEVRSRVTATEHSSVTDPINYYYDWDFTQIKDPPWVSIHTYAAPGYQDPTTAVQQSRDGRLALVTAPDAVGRAVRMEIRDSDPGWALDPTTARSQLQMSVQQTWNKNGVAVGDIRWFRLGIWLPNEFDYARSNWNTWMGLHPGSNTWGCFDLGGDGMSSHPQYLPFKIAGGSPIGTTANLHYYPLVQLTNANGSIYAPNRNRRIDILLGGRFAPDNTGWAEAWVDGVNVLPRVNRPTMWINDTQTYLKIGPYKNHASPYPSGSTIMYFTRVAIGTSA